MNSWDNFVNSLFDWCVQILIDGGHLLGISYNEINIWIFCIIEPIAFLLMLGIILWQWRKIRRLKAQTKLA
ncbi:MAG TPA: hypothetical protein VK154_04855 [Chitinophagales bacterium]|nr:hypothetical protein [Chitinophagales bacterium]